MRDNGIGNQAVFRAAPQRPNFFLDPCSEFFVPPFFFGRDSLAWIDTPRQSKSTIQNASKEGKEYV